MYNQKKNNQKIRKEQGITLIALVITIIVLLILAVVSINLLMNGEIINRANKGVQAYSDAEILEQIKLAKSEYEMAKYTGTNETEQEYMQRSLSNTFGTTVQVNKLGKNYKIELRDKVYTIKADGTISQSDIIEPMSTTTSVYAKLDTDGTLYLRATKQDESYKSYSNSGSISTNWSDKTPASVTKVVIEEPIAKGTYDQMLSNCTNLKTIENIKNMHTEKANNFNYMFNGCESIEELDLSSFDTSNVTLMNSTFSGCKKLKNLNIDNFNTSKCNQMAGMFKECELLNNIDVGSFDTSSVTDMRFMFNSCKSLKHIDISSFDTRNVQYMREMFSQNSQLESLDLSNFNTAGLGKDYKESISQEYLGSMFEGCTSLKELNLSNFNTENLTNMQSMFKNCTSLIKLDISSFDTSKVTNMYYTFYGDTALKELNLGRNFVIKEGCQIVGLFSYSWEFDFRTSGLKIRALESVKNRLLSDNNFKLSEDNFIKI